MVKQHVFGSQTVSTFLTTFCSHSVSSTECSAAVITAVLSAVGTYKRRYDLQFFDKLSRCKFPPKWQQFTYW